ATAYYYYLQQQYDSSAVYLEKSLSNAENRIERSRWEYLCGQMYQKGKLYDDANRMFAKSIKHSANPLLDVYAHLNMIGQYGDTSSNIKNRAPVGDVDALEKLAKKERYTSYRDIIYYAAAKICLQQKNKKNAANYFLKSATSSIDNPVQKSKSYLELADLKYDFKQYKPAYSYYDSVDLKVIDSIEVARVLNRKPALKIVSKNIDAVLLQDSLQLLAKLPAKELNLELKKIYKQYKKANGGKEDANDAFDFGSDNTAITNAPTGFQVDTKPGEFYFANESVKAQGIKDFKARWGNRPNVDNWNRASIAGNKIDGDKKSGFSDAEKALTDKQAQAKKTVKRNEPQKEENDVSIMGLGNPDVIDDAKIGNGISNSRNGIQTKDNNKDDVSEEVTPESLFNAIPLTAEKLASSNNSIIEALFKNGETFSEKLDDYPSAIAAYEELLRRFPKNKFTEQALFNLSYCYKRMNRADKELATQQKLSLDFSNGNLARIMKDKTANSESDSATRQYAGVYNMFLEGKYEEAKTAKSQADSVYKQKYWSPQLSFIESVYYIKQREDSIAIHRLNLIANGNAEPQLKEKARKMIEILKNRKQIEEYLSNLDSNGHYDSALARMNLLMKDSLAKAKLQQEKERQNVLKIDSSLIGKPFFNNPNEPHYAVLLLDNVDDVFINETVTTFNKYNKESLGNNALTVKSLKLNQQYNLILIGTLSNAPNGISYIDDVKLQTSKLLPWLPTFKYTYSLIGTSNLEILKANNNMDKYIKFLKTTFPNKF
ncbi:MAG: tetratricopeptide repeat protein, partial [Chitinophagaceae bacterium]